MKFHIEDEVFHKVRDVAPNKVISLYHCPVLFFFMNEFYRILCISCVAPELELFATLQAMFCLRFRLSEACFMGLKMTFYGREKIQNHPL